MLLPESYSILLEIGNREYFSLCAIEHIHLAICVNIWDAYYFFKTYRVFSSMSHDFLSKIRLDSWMRLQYDDMGFDCSLLYSKWNVEHLAHLSRLKCLCIAIWSCSRHIWSLIIVLSPLFSHQNFLWHVSEPKSFLLVKVRRFQLVSFTRNGIVYSIFL